MHNWQMNQIFTLAKSIYYVMLVLFYFCILTFNLYHVFTGPLIVINLLIRINLPSV